jgi:hypothetical protein
MTAQHVHALLCSREWRVFESRNSHVGCLCEFAEASTTSTLMTDETARIFNNIPKDICQIQ